MGLPRECVTLKVTLKFRQGYELQKNLELN